MEVTGSFFNKLRTLAVALEKQLAQLKQVLHHDDDDDETDFEDDSPMRYLHDLHSEIRTLKVHADNTLSKSVSQRDATYHFIKSSKVLMTRNASELEKIRDLFHKYGYQSPVGRDEEAQIHPESTISDQEEPKDIACSEKTSEMNSPLRMPQLSDFGLSKYAFPSTWVSKHTPGQACAQKEEPRMDESGNLSPKVEQFCIHERGLSSNDDTTNLTEDQTIFLLHAKNRNQASKMSGLSTVATSKVGLATPRQENKRCDYDYMASPAVPAFCTPGLKIPPKKNTTAGKSPENNKSDASNSTTNPLPDTQSGKVEPKQIQISRTMLNKDLVNAPATSTLPSDTSLECLEEPTLISDYSSFLSTPPPPPEITAVPKHILQMLANFHPSTAMPLSVEKATNEGTATKFERGSIVSVGNQENRLFPG